MEHNPYTPPVSASQAVPFNGDITFLRVKAPRPLAVWLLLATFAILLALLASKTLVLLRTVLLHSSSSISVLSVVIQLAVWLTCIGGIAVVAAYTHRGAPWCKWLGLALIVAITVSAFARPDTTFYANNAARTGGFVGRYVVVPLLLAWWAYAFAFSSKARHFFAGRVTRGT